MTKERIEKELLKVREQLAGLQARQKDLEEQGVKGGQGTDTYSCHACRA